MQIFEQECEKRLTKFCEDFEFGAVRRCDNLVDIEHMLQHEYSVANISRDTAQEEPSKASQNYEVKHDTVSKPKVLGPRGLHRRAGHARVRDARRLPGACIVH